MTAQRLRFFLFFKPTVLAPKIQLFVFLLHGPERGHPYRQISGGYRFRHWQCSLGVKNVEQCLLTARACFNKGTHQKASVIHRVIALAHAERKERGSERRFLLPLALWKAKLRSPERLGAVGSATGARCAEGQDQGCSPSAAAVAADVA